MTENRTDQKEKVSHLERLIERIGLSCGWGEYVNSPKELHAQDLCDYCTDRLDELRVKSN